MDVGAELVAVDVDVGAELDEAVDVDAVDVLSVDRLVLWPAVDIEVLVVVDGSVEGSVVVVDGSVPLLKKFNKANRC